MAVSGQDGIAACLQISVKDAKAWDEYRSLVGDTLLPWGGELVFRGEKTASLAGECVHPQIVVICFPTGSAAESWFASPSYQNIVPIRLLAADVTLTSYAT